MSKDVIQMTHINKIYGKKEPRTWAIQDINLNISNQSFTSIVGRSGSGKTTLLNLIGGLEQPTSGELLIHGKNIFQMKDSERTVFRRRYIGYIFQFFNLIPEMTVLENVCLPSYLDNNIPDAMLLEDIMKKLGLTSKKNKYAGELSGGEQQRVAVARALSYKPAILLADEPTGNLDKKTGDELIDLLIFSHRYFNQTILLVTHDLDLARMAQRMITLEDGRIISDTDHCDWKHECE